MSTKAVLSSRASCKSSSVTLNNDVDDKYHSCTTSIDANYLDPESNPAHHAHGHNLNDSQESDIDTLNDMYYEPKIDPEGEAKNGIYPWLVVLGTFLVLIFGLGAASGWGIMQNYFEQDESLQATSNLSLQLSFVGTIFNIFINLLGPFGQILLSLLLPRTVLFISISVCSIGLLLASFSTQMALTVVPLWFVKNRGMALGILSSGISIGGLVMPQVMEPLNHIWDKRPSKGNQKDESTNTKLFFKEMFDFSVVKNWRFLLWVFTDTLLEAGYNVPYFFLPSYATFLGLSSSQGATILSTSYGMNAVGRLISGVVADYVGHVNIVIVYIIISGISCLLLWVYANTFGTLMAFAMVFGFFGGAFITLTPTITLLVTGQEKFETGMALFLVLTVVSMFGPNLASAIESSSSFAKEYDSYKYFTGICYLAGAGLLLFFKLSLNRKPFAKI
ncbi:major facilitator superfamily domain-containing protein [Mucor lusitanicus]